MSVFGLGPILASDIYGQSAFYQEQEEFKRERLDPNYVAPSAMEEFFEQQVNEAGDIVYVPQPLNVQAADRPMTGNLDMNDKRLTNLATVDITSLESILATPNVAANVNTASSLSTFQIALNTAYCGPLFSTMDCKGKRVTNIADMEKLQLNDDSATTIAKLKQAVNYGSMNQIALVRDQNDGYQDFDASILGQNKHITGIDTTELTNLQMINFESGNPSEEVQKLVSQAVSVRYALENTPHAAARDVLDTTVPPQSSCYDSNLVNIQNGRAAVLPKDYVIKEQTIVEEEKELQYQVAEVVVGGPYRHFAFEDSNTVYTCSDPKFDPSGLITQFTKKDTVPPQNVPRNRQLCNLKYADEKAAEEANKKHSKTADIDCTDTYRVKNMIDPSSAKDAVTKSYCDSNSGKDTDGTGGTIFSTIFGALAGAVAGALTSFATQGLGSALGSVASAGAAAFGSFASSGLFNGGIRTGSSANLEGLKANNPIPNEGPLIDNLKDDIANRPPGQPDAGSLVSGAMSVSGLFRAVANAQSGLFDLVA